MSDTANNPQLAAGPFCEYSANTTCSDSQGMHGTPQNDGNGRGGSGCNIPSSEINSYHVSKMNLTYIPKNADTTWHNLEFFTPLKIINAAVFCLHESPLTRFYPMTHILPPDCSRQFFVFLSPLFRKHIDCAENSLLRFQGIQLSPNMHSVKSCPFALQMNLKISSMGIAPFAMCCIIMS